MTHRPTSPRLNAEAKRIRRWGPPRLDPDRQFLNKWEMYKVLVASPPVPFRLPVTRPYTRRHLLRLLRRFRGVYVKPVGGYGGAGVVRVSAESHDRFTVQPAVAPPQRVTGTDALLRAVATALGEAADDACIVQQAVASVKWWHRPMDIRSLWQRDELARWVHAGCVVRIGGRDAAVSNVALTGGQVLPWDRAMAGMGLKGPRALALTRQILHGGRRVCEALAPYREFEEVGLDLCLDGRGRLWLIEVNTDDAWGAPSHDLFQVDPALHAAIEERWLARRRRWLADLFTAIGAELQSGAACPTDGACIAPRTADADNANADSSAAAGCSVAQFADEPLDNLPVLEAGDVPADLSRLQDFPEHTADDLARPGLGHGLDEVDPGRARE